MEIYFDGVLIDEDNYTSLSTNFELFDSSFKLGSTASNTFELVVDKVAVSTQPNEVTIYQNGILVATLVVDNIEETDVEYKYTLTDKMVNLEFKYDASESFTNGSATLLEIAQDICNKAGIELATMDFRGYNKGINWYDNTRTAREYIGYIAELNGGYAQIGKDGRLYFIKQNTASLKTISIDDCSDFKIGEKHKITRVVYEQGALKYEYGDETGNTLYLNGDNVYITEQSEVEEIFNEINGFEFYSFSTSNCPIDFDIMAGQVITFTDGINEYPTIAGYELTFYGEWYGGYDLDVATKKQEETQVTGTSEKIRNLSIKVDRESNKITQAIQEIDDQNQKISEVTQTVNELNSKISDIADITTSKESTNGTVSFEKINQSEPIYVRIYPTGINISYLYPHANLFPSETLFLKVRTLRFTNTTTNEYFDYELPTDLLYYDAESYDEFILDYDAQSCVVNKRVGYNADGTTYVLENPKTIEYEYPRIELTDGDYVITLLGYHNAYIFVRLMAQNMYTTQWATKAELNSEISQTASEIDLSVNKKLSNYSTTTQMNSAINLKANEITSTVNEKFKNYSTTSQMNSAITQKANEITSSVSETYETKSNATTNYSKLTQTANSLQSQISANDKDISTIKQTATSLQSQITSNDNDISTIKQSVNEVNIEVGKKYNTSDFTNAKITAKINDGTSSVKINANKIELSATDILNLLAGNTINLSSKNITISSDSLNIDENGKMTFYSKYIGEVFEVKEDSSSKKRMYMNQAGLVMDSASETGLITLGLINDNEGSLRLSGAGGYTRVRATGITTPSVTQTSKESKKKNISKYNEKALDIVKDSTIYEFNFKSEKDKEKKHLGFVIGDEGGKYKTPEQVISNDREGIESYSMTSILWKAFQEYIAEKDEQIKQLQNEIKELKKESE